MEKVKGRRTPQRVLSHFCVFFIAAAAFVCMCCVAVEKENGVQNAVQEDGAMLTIVEYPIVKSEYPAPFSKGVNLSEWFQAPSDQAIPFTKFTRDTFVQLKELGVDTARLPINLHAFTSGDPDYTLSPLFLKLLDQVVDWAEEQEIYLILDNHSFNPVANTSERIGDVLIPVWTNMAEHFKNRSAFVIYEILNEPHGIQGAVWSKIQGQVIEAIRAVDTVHSIIVGGVNFNALSALSPLPEYPDTNLIYTFHFYDPYLFTHQGETWGSPPNLRNLKGLPFPSGAHDLPQLPSELRTTWVADNLKGQYQRDAKTETLAGALNKAAEFSNKRKVPVFCGEFGVYMINALAEDRVRWYDIVTNLLDERGIARTSWDYTGGFGVFKTPQGGNFYADLNADVVRAMGFNMPEQRELAKIRTSFVLYDDFPRSGASISAWGTEDDTRVSLYEEDAADGAYSLLWENPDQYEAVFFTLPPTIDWAYLKDEGYALRFKAKIESAQNVSFDMRFLDMEREGSLPWRMRAAINSAVLPSDGAWHTVTIPLSSMNEGGAWVSATEAWLEPRGEFSWDAIDRLEFTAEQGSISGIIRFDSVEIVKP